MCVRFFVQPSEIFIILRRIQQDAFLKYIHLHVKHLLFLSYFNETWIFLTYFLKKTQALNFMKSHPLGAMLFQADGQTDVMKLIDASCSFVKRPTNRRYVHDKHYSVCLPVDMSCNEQSFHVRVFVMWSNSHSGIQSFKNYQKVMMQTQCHDVVWCRCGDAGLDLFL